MVCLDIRAKYNQPITCYANKLAGYAFMIVAFRINKMMQVCLFGCLFTFFKTNKIQGKNSM